MVGRNENVSQVLVPSAGLAILGVGLTLDNLAIGQLGVFDKNTGLSIDAAGAGAVRDFYIAIARSSNNNAVIDTMDFSAGDEIQKRNIEKYSFREHTASQPHIVEVKDYKVECDTEYCIKLEYRNEETRAHNGFTPFYKSYVVTTACCDECADCASGDANELSLLFTQAINNDTNGFATAEIIATTAVTAATHGTAVDYAIGDVVSEADAALMTVWNLAQADDTTRVFTKFVVTSTEVSLQSYCNVNTMYYAPRQTQLILSLSCGFECTGTVEEVQALSYEEGAGYDIQNKEFRTLAHKTNSAYKQSGILGLADSNIVYHSVVGTKYDQFIIEYNNLTASTGGNGKVENNLDTILAIPTGEDALRASVSGILDALITPLGFDALADDSATADADDTVVVDTENLGTAGDGIA